MEETIETAEQRLSRLGFGAAATKIKEAKIMSRKLAIAYEHYRFVRQEKIDAFNQKLRMDSNSYKMLAFTDINQYDQVPPGHVLEALEVAMERKCFDSYEVARIVEVKDPILFGRINNCPDRFFIAQWDDDVKIEDIISPNEG